MTKIAFIGLGKMGSGMCANLLRAGHEINGFDVNPENLAAAAKAGARPCASIAQALDGAGMLITMLPAGEDVRAVLFGEGGAAGHGKPSRAGLVVVDCSTIAVEAARALAQEAQRNDFAFVDAPVSGGVAAAKSGQLTFMVGGAAESFARAKPVLAAMGKNIFHAGAAGNGQAAKIANNMLLAISMIGTCEAFNLAQRLGLEIGTFFDIATNASGQCWSMTAYCPAPGPVPGAPSNDDYRPGFTAAMMVKDLRLALGAAERVAAHTPLGAHAKSIYEAMAKKEMAEMDFSGVMRLVEKGETG